MPPDVKREVERAVRRAAVAQGVHPERVRVVAWAPDVDRPDRDVVEVELVVGGVAVPVAATVPAGVLS